MLRKLLTPQLGSGALPELTVGFVDLVGYTALSQELDGAELNALVARFEGVTYDTVAQLGGRLVKTIGDEVMFVAEEPEVALQIALELTDRTRQDEVLPRARAGMACGPALAREGDYYGAVVNLAHRLVEIAPAAVDHRRRPSWPTRSTVTTASRSSACGAAGSAASVGSRSTRPGRGRAGRGRPGVGPGRGG